MSANPDGNPTFTNPFRGNQPISPSETGPHPGIPPTDPSTGNPVLYYSGASGHEWAPGAPSQTAFTHSEAVQRRNAVSEPSASSNPNTSWANVTGVSEKSSKK